MNIRDLDLLLIREKLEKESLQKQDNRLQLEIPVYNDDYAKQEIKEDKEPKRVIIIEI
jgi:hypothetical protein